MVCTVFRAMETYRCLSWAYKKQMKTKQWSYYLRSCQRLWFQLGCLLNGRQNCSHFTSLHNWRCTGFWSINTTISNQWYQTDDIKANDIISMISNQWYQSQWYQSQWYQTNDIKPMISNQWFQTLTNDIKANDIKSMVSKQWYQTNYIKPVISKSIILNQWYQTSDIKPLISSQWLKMLGCCRQRKESCIAFAKHTPVSSRQLSENRLKKQNPQEAKKNIVLTSPPMIGTSSSH